MAYATVPPQASGGVEVDDDGVSTVSTATILDFVDTASVTFTITPVSAGRAKVEATASGGGGGGAPDTAQYVVLATHAGLSAERVLTPESTVLTLTDGGANGAATLGVATAGITFAKFQDMTARSLHGRAANSTGVSAAISGGGAGTYANDNATSIAFRAVTDIIQNLALSGDISPSQLTANVDDYNPTSLATASVLRLDSDASRDITGLQGGADGRFIGLLNIGSFNVVLKDASASSSVANRFALGADCTLLPGHAAILWYDSTSSRWRGFGRFFPFTAAPVVTLTAGAGLTGGGDTSANRTFDVAANADGSIVVNANDVQVGVLATDAQHGNRGGGALHANAVASGAAGFMSGADKAALDAAVPNTRTITAGAGLTGGGDFSANRTFAVAAGDSSITVNADDIIVAALGITAAKLAADAVITSKILDGNVTLAKVQDFTARCLLGRAANSTGVSGLISGGGASTFASDDGSTVAFRVVSDIPQNLSLSGDLTPAQITGNQNNYNPTSLSTALVLRLDTDASRTLTGLAGGADGRLIIIVNVGAFDLVLADESTSSTAGNRFAIGADRTIGTKQGIVLWYDSTSSRWRATDQPPGAGGSGAPTDATYLTLTTNGSLSNERVLTASARVTITDAGAGSTATLDIGTNSIADTHLRQGAARSVVGVTGNATANVADIAGTADQVLRVNGAGTALAFGTIAAGGIASDAVTTAKILDANVTDAKLANMGARTVKGRSANSSGVPADIAGAGADTFLSDNATSLAFRVVSTIPQNLALSGDISPSQITANQNDYNPTSLSTSSVLRLDSDASRTITGLQGGADGRILMLINIGSFPIVLSTANASSSAANRFDFGRTLTLLPKRSVGLYYDSTSSRWRLLDSGAEQTVNTLTDGANIATNRDLGWQHAVTLGGNRTMDAPTGTLIDGMWTSYAVFQDGTGSRTLAFATGAGAFRATELSLSQTLSTAAGKCDYFVFRYNATDNRHDLMDFRKAA